MCKKIAIFSLFLDQEHSYSGYRSFGVPCLLTALSYVYLTYMLRISYVIDKEKQRPNIPFEREGDSYRIPAGYETAFHLLNLN